MSNPIELLPQTPSKSADLVLPNGIKPSNLSLPPGTKIEYIHNDVFGVCEQLREIDPSLYIVLLTGDDKYAWAIMENCHDGLQRLVFKTAELDARVLDRIRKMMALPLKERIARIDAEHKKREEERKEARKDEAVETIALPMYQQLEKDGFLQRPKSYPKTGVTGGKGSLKRS